MSNRITLSLRMSRIPSSLFLEPTIAVVPSSEQEGSVTTTRASNMESFNQSQLVGIAEDILNRTKKLIACLSDRSAALPSLEVGARSELWITHDGDIQQHSTALRGLMQQLDKLIEGPHGFLHEYVSINWEHGALYALLEFGVLEQIPVEGAISIARLAEKSGLPSDKLLRICRLAACAGILREIEEGVFAHTAISEELVRDTGFRSFIAFQCVTKTRGM